MYQRRKENINMPRPHQQQQFLRHNLFIGKIDTHVLARRYKNDEHREPKNKMKPFHGDCYNNTAELKCFDTKTL